MSKFTGALALGLIGLFVLTGCGGGEDATTSNGDVAPNNAPIKKVKL